MKKKRIPQKKKLLAEIDNLQNKVQDLEKMRMGRKRAHEALQESIELYQTLVEISPEAIAILDLSADIIMVNQQAVELYGAKGPEELIGKSAFEMLIPEDRERARKNIQRTLKQPLRNIQYQLIKKNNVIISAEINSSVIKSKQGKPIAIMAVLRDVTERKVIERALKEGEERYRILCEGAIAGVYIIQDDKFYYVNPAICKMFGYTRDEIISNMSPLNLTYPDDRATVTRYIKRRLFGEAKSAHYTFRGLRKDGAMLYCESLGRSIKIDGRPAIIGTLLDITERTRIEKELLYKDGLKNIITDLSAEFVNLNTNQLEEAVKNALRKIGEFTCVDRSYIFQLYDGGRRMDNTYEWCALGIEPQIKKLKKLKTADFPWALKKLKKMSTVYVPRVEDLPRQAKAEKKEWQAEKIRSLINVPMVFQGEVIGFLGLDSVKEEKAWPEDAQTLLRIAAGMFANIIKRRQMDRDIKLLNKELLKTNVKLKQLALRDSLTNLYNHRYFAEAIEAEFIRAQRHSLPLSVIMLDIDYFKSINDVYGHQFGDTVLKQLARQLTRMVRKYDTVIRYGGEEFIIITPEADKKIAVILAQRLLDVIKLENFGDKQHKVKLKVSVSVACFPEDKIHKGNDFIKIADFTLNKVKETGGDKVYAYSDVSKGRDKTMLTAESEADVKELKEKLGKLTRRANESLAEAIFAFAKTIEIKDHYTGEHVEKTVHYATEIAREKNLSKEEIERIRQAAILHDLGKIGISEKILLKRTKLTVKEYAEIKGHPQIAADILRPIHFFQSIIPFILHHHERWDGKGYPFGLKGDEIPLGARIIALADTYEALTSDRRYRKACSKKEAIKRIKRVSGTQFDPEIVKLFLNVMKREER